MHDAVRIWGLWGEKAYGEGVAENTPDQDLGQRGGACDVAVACTAREWDLGEEVKLVEDVENRCVMIELEEVLDIDRQLLRVKGIDFKTKR